MMAEGPIPRRVLDMDLVPGAHDQKIISVKASVDGRRTLIEGGYLILPDNKTGNVRLVVEAITEGLLAARGEKVIMIEGDDSPEDSTSEE